MLLPFFKLFFKKLFLNKKTQKMHYLRCIHSIAPSVYFFLLFCFFCVFLFFCFCPRGRQTLANFSPQPHWLRKQTGVFAKHPFHLWMCLRNTKHPNPKLKTENHPFLDLSPVWRKTPRYFQCWGVCGVV